MEILGMILIGVGGIIALVGSIMFLIVAFKESILWGLGCIFVPFVSLVFLIMHWSVAKKPFLVSLCALPFYIIGILMGGLGSQPPQ